MFELIKGKGPGMLCNGYRLGNIVIDAPLNSEPPKDAELLIITHSHCDHFIGAEHYNFEKAGSSKTKQVIENHRDDFCLCRYVGFDFPDLKINLELNDGMFVEKGEIIFQIIETPGHCDGSICLYELNKKYLFSGDTVFPDYNLPRTDLPSSDISKLRDSYEKLSNLEIETIYPGHGKEIKEKDYIKKLIKIL